eukprot:361252-Chlamydomonas_euryale.AAC.5
MPATRRKDARHQAFSAALRSGKPHGTASITSSCGPGVDPSLLAGSPPTPLNFSLSSLQLDRRLRRDASVCPPRCRCRMS